MRQTCRTCLPVEYAAKLNQAQKYPRNERANGEKKGEPGEREERGPAARAVKVVKRAELRLNA